MSLVKTQVTLGDLGPFDCYVEDDRPTWNGFANPWFTQEQAEVLFRALGILAGFPPGERKCQRWEDDSHVVTTPAYRWGDQDLYRIAAGKWDWIEVTAEKDTTRQYTVDDTVPHCIRVNGRAIMIPVFDGHALADLLNTIENCGDIQAAYERFVK